MQLRLMAPAVADKGQGTRDKAQGTWDSGLGGSGLGNEERLMATTSTEYTVFSIGRVRSTLTRRAGAPRQGWEGAPDAWLEIQPAFVRGLDRMKAGQEIVILTWLHEAKRDVLLVHPRDDRSVPLTGVFATRSPDRPNPIGLHRVKLLSIEQGPRLHVEGLEAIDGTPIIDIKPVLERSCDF
jgi:tRNA-Thr(GGU) m(6)t(6)A37 methyltransferase TsaA